MIRGKACVIVRVRTPRAAISVQIHCRNQSENRRERRAIDHKKIGKLRRCTDALVHVTQTEHRADNGNSQKFQRINKQQDREKQAGVEKNGPAIVERKASKQLVVCRPDLDQHGEGQPKGQKAVQVCGQFRIVFRHFQRNDKQRTGKREYSIAETLQSMRHYRFIASKNSELVLVSFILSSRNSTADNSSIGCNNLRRIQIFANSPGSVISSSLRVPERLM